LEGPLDYSRVPSPAVAAATGRKLRGARDEQRAGAAISAELKPRPSGNPPKASRRGEKSGLGRMDVETVIIPDLAALDAEVGSGE
jgi:hypothetical protein